MTDTTDKDKKPEKNSNLEEQPVPTETDDAKGASEAPKETESGDVGASQIAGQEETESKNTPAPEKDENELPTQEKALSEVVNEAEQSGSSKGSVLLLGVLVLLVLVVTALGFGGYKAWQEYQKIDSTMAAREAAINANLQAINAIKSELMESSQAMQQMQKSLVQVNNQTQAAIAEQTKTLNQMAQRLDGQQTRINTLSTTSREDWLLAEAEYLLRLANQRVLLERNPLNALALLTTADEIIKQVSAGLGDPELFAIRKTLAREMTELKLVTEVDKAGIYIKLGALGEKVTQLPRIPENPLRVAEEDEIMEFPSETEHWWDGLWQLTKESLGALDQYIKIDDTESAVKPLLQVNDAMVVASNVQILLQQAQLAVLQEESDVYQNSLTSVIETISTHYIPSHERDQFLEQVKTFEAFNVAPHLPNISTSLNLLNGYIQKLHKLEGK